MNNMAYGKTMELFFVDGTPEGIIIAELTNWNGTAIKISRKEVPDCQRTDITGVGVYFLFCQDDDEESVYIGESENVLSRLKQHITSYNKDKEKFYWSQAVVFVGSRLDKALIRYIENRFVIMAKEAGHYKILTSSTFQNAILKESQIATCEEFIDNMSLIINALGYNVLEAPKESVDENEYLYCTGAGSNSKGFVSSDGFTVVKGSVVSDHIVPSMKTRAKSYHDLRLKLVDEGVIVDRVFTKNYEFRSPSAAAAVIQGRSSNGKIDWKTKTGLMLKQLDI